MLTRQGAFLVGYTVPIIGIHFEATELLAEAGRGATGALATRIRELIESFAERRAGVVDNVRQMTALLAESRIDVGAPPRSPAEYFRWRDAIAAEYSSRSSAKADLEALAEDAARLFGYALGDTLLTLNLVALVEHLRDVAPDHQWLTRQAAALAAEQERTAGVIGRAVDNPLLPVKARPSFQVASKLASGSPRAGGADALATLKEVQEAMRAIAAEVPVVEGAFAGTVSEAN